MRGSIPPTVRCRWRSPAPIRARSSSRRAAASGAANRSARTQLQGVKAGGDRPHCSGSVVIRQLRQFRKAQRPGEGGADQHSQVVEAVARPAGAFAHPAPPLGEAAAVGELHGRLGALLVNGVRDPAQVIEDVVLQAHLVVQGAPARLHGAVGDGAKPGAALGERLVKARQPLGVRTPAGAVALKGGGLDEAVAQFQPAQPPRRKGIDGGAHTTRAGWGWRGSTRCPR